MADYNDDTAQDSTRDISSETEDQGSLGGEQSKKENPSDSDKSGNMQNDLNQ